MENKMDAPKALLSAKELFTALQTGPVHYGYGIYFVQCEGTFNVFIDKTLQFTGEFTLQKVEEAIEHMNIFVQVAEKAIK